MSSKLGRPPIENPKEKRINIRITEQTHADLIECAEALEISKTEVIELGIQKVKAGIKK